MDSNQQYAEIILPLAVKGLFTYAVPLEFSIDALFGKRVIVQFGSGRKLYTGIAVGFTSEKPSFEVKDIIEVLDDQPIISESGVDFWKWMATYYMCSIGEVMNAALPGALNISSESIFMLNRDIEVDVSALSQNEVIVLNALESHEQLSMTEISRLVDLKSIVSLMNSLAQKEIVFLKEQVKRKYKSKTVDYLSLSGKITNGNDLEEVILSLNRAPKQLKLLMALIELSEWDGEEASKKFIRKDEVLSYSGASATSLKSLIEKDLLTVTKKEESRIEVHNNQRSALKKLNAEQKESIDLIKLQHREKDVVLLHGVTSSGKTEIYAHLIEEILQKGKQVLYLLPEIALTNQLINRLQQYFGNKIAVYHSRLSQSERAEVWHRVAKNSDDDIQIILGARSSIFLPFNDLGLIVVDEEHDRSFKQQDPSPRYEARDGAVVLASYHKAKVLLGSATPSMESIFNTKSGKYGFVEMKKRFGGFAMPELLAVDLTEERRKRKIKGAFSSVLYNEIEETLQRKEQIILFQNRRGYAPFVLCSNCAHTPACVNCDVSLTHHKKRNALICHYCGYQISMMTTCRECGTGKFSDIGLGTQRIEEDLSNFFPNANLARFDLDSTRKKNAFQNLLNDFESHAIDILIGTQMVTKGLDFENVGLVGIINADSMLRFPDFRSFERTYQMLTQVSGRAGRKRKQGKVIIQTYDPFHPIMQFVLSNDFKGFVKNEMEERKLFHYPPFYRMIDVRLKHRDRQVLYESSMAFGKDLKNLFGPALLGPEFPYIERIRNLYSMHFILKVSKNASVGTFKKKLEKAIAVFTSKDTFKSLKVQIDVDPY